MAQRLDRVHEARSTGRYPRRQGRAGGEQERRGAERHGVRGRDAVEERGEGLAQRVTEFLIAQARRDGLTALYLLSETAGSYFERFGFESVARDAVPPAVAATRQFAELCPQSAACLRLTLRGRCPDS